MAGVVGATGSGYGEGRRRNSRTAGSTRKTSVREEGQGEGGVECEGEEGNERVGSR